MDQDIKREFDRLHREIKSLKEVQTKSTWVGHSWITEVTGWSKRRLQRAREQGVVEFKKSESGGLLYKLESIPEIFIHHPLKQQQ